MKKIFILSVLLCVMTLMGTAYALQPPAMQSGETDSAPEENSILDELSESLGNMQALDILSDLRTLMKSAEDISDEALQAKILRIAGEHDIELTEPQVKRLVTLCRRIEKINAEELKEKAGKLKDTVKNLTDRGQSASGFWQNARAFFRNVFGFVSRLFKKYA